MIGEELLLDDQSSFLEHTTFSGLNSPIPSTSRMADVNPDSGILAAISSLREEMKDLRNTVDSVKRPAPNTESKTGRNCETDTVNNESLKPAKRAKLAHVVSSSDEEDTPADTVDADIESLFRDEEKSDSDDFFGSMERELSEDEPCGPDIDPKLAKFVNGRFSKTMTTEKVKEKQGSLPRPSNCEQLIVPKNNPEIFCKLDKYQKSRDQRMSNVQRAITKAGVAVIMMLEMAAKPKISSEDSISIRRRGTDALALLGHANSEMNMRRREAMRPALKREYEPLCSDAVPVSGLLFGDDLSKRLKELKQSSMVGKEASRAPKNGTWSPGWQKRGHRFKRDTDSRPAQPFEAQNKHWNKKSFQKK